MEVEITSFAVVAEAVTAAVTGVAVEMAPWVGGGREKREMVVRVGRVGDELCKLGARHVEGEVAGPASVHIP